METRKIEKYGTGVVVIPAIKGSAAKTSAQQ
jgi:hypothetical protein